MRVVMWSGSLGSKSSNRAALDCAARWLDNAGATVAWAVQPHLLPAFEPELAAEPPAPVLQLRRQLGQADAVLMAAAEYAGGLAGVAKNALDWLVGSRSLRNTLVGVLSVGATGGFFARDQMVRTLSYHGAITVASTGIAMPDAGMAADLFADPGTISTIEGWAADVVIAHRLTHEQRVAKAAPVLEAAGIDPARFAG